jgi:hypothetical protein
MSASFDTSVQKNEDRLTTAVEEQTSRVPSIAYLGLAIGSMAASLAFMLAGKKQIANFIGHWAPSLLVIGLYNKVVKLEDELIGLRGPQQRRLVQPVGS